jgi:hypothetical protein
MNLAIPPQDLVMFLTIVTAAGFLTSYVCYQWQRNKKTDSLLISNEELQASNEELQDTIKKQGIAVNKVLNYLINEPSGNDPE